MRAMLTVRPYLPSNPAGKPERQIFNSTKGRSLQFPVEKYKAKDVVGNDNNCKRKKKKYVTISWRTQFKCKTSSRTIDCPGFVQKDIEYADLNVCYIIVNYSFNPIIVGLIQCLHVLIPRQINLKGFVFEPKEHH